MLSPQCSIASSGLGPGMAHGMFVGSLIDKPVALLAEMLPVQDPC